MKEKRIANIAETYLAERKEQYEFRQRVFGFEKKPEDEMQPIYWICMKYTDSSCEYDVIFVNGSDETLDYVNYYTACMLTVDDDFYSSHTPKGQYTKVKPGEAVKIDLYNEVYDSDYLISYQIELS
ncbi:MAG: hypothetical protein OEY78_11525, partial [Gammaproteobacteria bacterium]|nr:hypothetical protein [Gammaproteobacteria bacterium]